MTILLITMGLSQSPSNFQINIVYAEICMSLSSILIRVSLPTMVSLREDGGNRFLRSFAMLKLEVVCYVS